jgi:hypothetical protein
MNADETFESLWAYCSTNNRLVPLPPQWMNLFKLLKQTRQNDTGGWTPPLPLILAAWHHSIPIAKQLRFKEHLEWAEKKGQINEIGIFLRSLKENEWCHYGEI